METSIRQGFELSGESTPLGALLRDTWRSRGILRILARKEFYVRYRRATFGLLWAVGLPLVQASVLSVVFSRIVRFETGIDFPVFVFSGILPWTFFNASVNAGTTSIVDGSNIATRIYFPRGILPLVVLLSNFYGLVPGLGLLVVMALAFGVSLGPEIVLLVPATALLVITAASFSLVLSALHVYFRDMKHIVGALTLPWFWGSGVFYPLERLGDLAQWIRLNPVVGVIELFRAAFGAAGDNWQLSVWIAVGWAAGLLAVAAALHRRFDRVLVDLM